MTSQVTFIIAFLLSSVSIIAQTNMTQYEPNAEFPFGRYNPDVPEQLKDFQSLLGECTCKSFTRKKDQTWADPEDMIWRWKYIMNGKGIQDETLKADGRNSGSIRQFDKDRMRWNVHYYSSAGTPKTLPTWHGNKKDGKIVLYRPQKAPNGMDGFYRLTFYEISKKGYKWVGEWVDKNEQVAFPTWRIECIREDEP